MYQPLTFDEWYRLVKEGFAREGLTLPDDIDLIELAHMECVEDEKSVEQFIRESSMEQKNNSTD